MIQNEILLKHLSTVFDPELGANIVELGMIKDIQHIDKTVTIKLALTIADCPMRNQIETEINRKLKLLEKGSALLWKSFLQALKIRPMISRRLLKQYSE